MNSENNTNKVENQKRTPPVSPRVATYKKPATLKRNGVPAVSVGKVRTSPTVRKVEKPQPSEKKTVNEIKKDPVLKAAAESAAFEEQISKSEQTFEANNDENVQVIENTENLEKTENTVKTESAAKIEKTVKPATDAKPVKKAPVKRKKTRLREGISPKVAALIALVGVALIVGAIILSMHLAGHRHVKATFEDNVSATTYTVTFIGKVDAMGVPVTGTLTYEDGLKAKIFSSESGKVRVEYKNGNVYEGEFRDLHRNGEGTFTMKNGDVYKGEFFYDRMWGEGEYYFANGDFYKGEFVNNVKEGNGVYGFANGDVYEGSFSGNMRNGEGLFTYADGSSYEGAFVNDKKEDDNAKMVTLYSDGTKDVYVGAYKNDMRHGKGTYTFANGDSYTGDFKENFISGHGIYTWASGRSYEGEFLNGAIVKDSTVYPQ